MAKVVARAVVVISLVAAAIRIPSSPELPLRLKAVQARRLQKPEAERQFIEEDITSERSTHTDAFPWPEDEAKYTVYKHR